MKAIILPRDKVVKIRYNNDSELPDLLTELHKISNLVVENERKYKG